VALQGVAARRATASRVIDHAAGSGPGTGHSIGWPRPPASSSAWLSRKARGDTALRAFQVIEVSATAKNFDDRLDTAFSRALLETKKSLDRLARGLALDDRRQRFLRHATHALARVPLSELRKERRAWRLIAFDRRLEILLGDSGDLHRNARLVFSEPGLLRDRRTRGLSKIEGGHGFGPIPAAAIICEQ